MAKLGCVRTLLMAATAISTIGFAARPASAQDASKIESIERQIQSLEQELKTMKRQLSTRDSQVKAAQSEAAKAREAAQRAQSQANQAQTQADQAQTQAAAAQSNANQVLATQAQAGGQPLVAGTGKMGQVRVGAVTVTFGGFLEAAGIFRSRNEVADIASNFNTGIPLPISPLYHETELRGSARQSRLSMLVDANPNNVTHLSSYVEADFLGAAPTANSVESNSYTPRLRQYFATYDRSDWGFHFLGGQAWSLLTMNKIGIVPRTEVTPLTIDAQYVPGFTWTRNLQFRATKEFDDHKLWLAASLESPQAVYYIGPNGTGVLGGGTVNAFNPGGSGYYSGNNYSTDIMPDIIVKAAADPGFGHYEVYGLARQFNVRVSTVGNGSNKNVLGGGGGADAQLPIVPHLLDFQASFLAGDGIGRYGSAQLPDATISQTGAPAALPEIEALVGLIGHPVPALDVYGYVGTEQQRGRSFASGGKGFGYGSPLYSNLGCNIELSPLACVANTSGVTQGTIGTWWRFLKGDFGTMQAGIQYSYTRRQIFQGIGGSPRTDDNMVFVSFRYYPFQ